MNALGSNALQKPQNFTRRSSALPTSTAATSIAAARGVLASLEREFDDASGDTSEAWRPRNHPGTAKN